MKTVVGLFEKVEDADRAVNELEDAGFSNDISVLARGSVVDELLNSYREEPEEINLETLQEQPSGISGQIVERGVEGGGVVGGLAGLVGGISAITIPGLGPVVIAGALLTIFMSTVSGAAIGATVGGILSEMVKMGMPEEDVETYMEGVRRGGVLIIVQASEDRSNKVRRIMQDMGAANLN